jgi:hypothetical protein
MVVARPVNVSGATSGGVGGRDHAELPRVRAFFLIDLLGLSIDGAQRYTAGMARSF